MRDFKEFRVAPKVAFDVDALNDFIQNEFGDKASRFQLVKRSIDARKRQTVVLLRFAEKTEDNSWSKSSLKNVSNSTKVHVVGSGPAGLFAAIRLIELGLKPLVVHMDNGWNSELAQHNIENLIKKLNVDLFTHHQSLRLLCM